MTARPVATILHTPFAIVFIMREPSHRSVLLLLIAAAIFIYRPFLYAPLVRIPFIDPAPLMCIKMETLHTGLWFFFLV
jgi:hypothetical protein